MYVPHSLFTFGGKLGESGLSGAEEWSCGIRLTTHSSATPTPATLVDATLAQTNAAVEQVTNAAVAMFVDQSMSIKHNAWISWGKLNAIAPSGKYLHDITSEYTFTPQAGANNSGEGKPFQISRVMTLETGKDRGLTAKGRIYLPIPGEPVNANGQATQTQQMIDTFADFIMALKINVDGVWFYPSVVTKTTRAGSQGYRLVTSVSVGNILDTQRRRRNQLTETRLRAVTD